MKGVTVAKKKGVTTDPSTGEKVAVKSLTVKPIVTGFVITCPECKDSKQHKVSEFAPSIEIGPYRCEKCSFEHTFTPSIKVGGTKRRYL